MEEGKKMDGHRKGAENVGTRKSVLRAGVPAAALVLLHDVLAETGSTLLHVENATSFGLAQRMKAHTRPHSLLRIPPLQASTLHRSRYLPFATHTRAQDAFAASQPRQECAKP
jgi:hypothetical protein